MLVSKNIGFRVPQFTAEAALYHSAIHYSLMDHSNKHYSIDSVAPAQSNSECWAHYLACNGLCAIGDPIFEPAGFLCHAWCVYELYSCSENAHPECAPGETVCNGKCVNTGFDNFNCGGCSQECIGGSCVGGNCTCGLNYYVVPPNYDPATGIGCPQTVCIQNGCQEYYGCGQSCGGM